MTGKKFEGYDGGTATTTLYQLEQKAIKAFLPRIPKWINSKQMVLLSLVWSIGMIVFGYLSTISLNWLWLSSLLIVLHWFTDSTDGALGRYRKEGLIKWGFFMDHFLDYIFACSVFIGYAFLFQGIYQIMILLLTIIIGGFMVHSFLRFATIKKFELDQFNMSPTEGRIIFILVNTAIIFFGTRFMEIILAPIVIVSTLGLAFFTYKTSQKLIKIDLRIKKESLNQNNKKSKRRL